MRGFATGTALHADAITGGIAGPRLADVEGAFSAANVDSTGFAAASRETENQIFTQPTDLAFAGENSSARGSGLELGLGDGLPAEAGSVVSLNKANAVAPPDSVDAQDLGLPSVPPLLYASLLHGDAIAQWEGLTCLTTRNSPISYGRGYAADLELLDAGAGSPDGSLEAPVVATDDPDPNRNAITSWSFIYAQPNGDPGRFGLVSEVHQTYAPIEVLQDPATGGTIEIEVLGEWFFRATATGKAGGATIGWGVTDPATGLPIDPTATVIRISAGGSEVIALSLNDIAMSPEGLEVPLDPLLNLMLAEDPRAISAPGGIADPTSSPTLLANGTRAAGAVDVVRLNVLDDLATLPVSVADLRVGHFETDIEVPAGGFSCTPPTTTSTTTTTTTAPTTTTSTSTSTTTTSSTTTTTAAPTTTTSTSTTTTTAAPTTTTTTAPPPTSTTAPTTTSTTSPPPPAPPAVPIRVQPRTVG